MAKNDWKKISKKITSFGLSIFTLANVIACNSKNNQEYEPEPISLEAPESIDSLQEAKLRSESWMTIQDNLLEDLQYFNNNIKNVALYA